jgi:hypothetical protein
MGFVQENAAEAVRRAVGRLSDGAARHARSTAAARSW